MDCTSPDSCFCSRANRSDDRAKPNFTSNRHARARTKPFDISKDIRTIMTQSDIDFIQPRHARHDRPDKSKNSRDQQANIPYNGMRSNKKIQKK